MGKMDTIMPPDDVLETMVDAFNKAIDEGIVMPPPVTDVDAMQAALTVAAALGYVLVKQEAMEDAAPDERTLPELGNGWRLSCLCEYGDPQTNYLTNYFEATVFKTDVGSFDGYGPTPRAAVLAAIGKIKEPT